MDELHPDPDSRPGGADFGEEYLTTADPEWWGECPADDPAVCTTGGLRLLAFLRDAERRAKEAA